MNSKNNFIRMFILWMSGATCFFAAPAFAEFQFGGGLGSWFGNYSESYGPSHASLKLTPSLGLHAFVGFSHQLFFAHWSPTVLTGGKLNGNSNDPSSANYFAPLSLEFGVTGLHSDYLPPVEIFAGAEYGEFVFSNGSKTSLNGSALKLGVNYFPLHLGRFNHIGFRGEYRHYFMSIDNYGTVPVNSSISTYYVGMVYEFSLMKKERSEEVSHPASVPAVQAPVQPEPSPAPSVVPSTLPVQTLPDSNPVREEQLH